MVGRTARNTIATRGAAMHSTWTLERLSAGRIFPLPLHLPLPLA